MIAAWMVYCVAVGALLGAAAHASESMLRTYARPARWVWALSLFGSVALPVVAWVAPVFWSRPATDAPDTGVLAVLPIAEWRVPLETLGNTFPVWEALNVVLLGGWLAGSLVLAGVFLRSFAKLAGERRGWRRAVVGTVPVLVSRGAGPAVVGVIREEIVLPEWVLDLQEDVRKLIAKHEEQHVRAGDIRLLVSALIVVLLLPWNVALWWQLRRLRLAVEADCDRRVLMGGADVRVYGTLLIEMGRRATGRLPALAFSHRRSSLARRIELMTWRPRLRMGRALVAASFAVALVFMACETPAPQAPDAEPPKAVNGLVDLKLQGCESMDAPGCSGLGPLYVVDGVIIADRSVLDVEALDIKRIEVIKGAAAEELYGKRAAGGVVSIFTQGGVHVISALGAESITEVFEARQARRMAAWKALAEDRSRDSSSGSHVVQRAFELEDSLRAEMTKEQLHELKKRPR